MSCCLSICVSGSVATWTFTLHRDLCNLCHWIVDRKCWNRKPQQTWTNMRSRCNLSLSRPITIYTTCCHKTATINYAKMAFTSTLWIWWREQQLKIRNIYFLFLTLWRNQSRFLFSYTWCLSLPLDVIYQSFHLAKLSGVPLEQSIGRLVAAQVHWSDAFKQRLFFLADDFVCELFRGFTYTVSLSSSRSRSRFQIMRFSDSSNHLTHAQTF